jgi:hypothetical protein
MWDYSPIISTLGFALALATALLVIPTHLAVWRVLAILRERHGPEWQRLGSPSFLLPALNAAHSKFAAFIKERQYRHLHDPELEKYADRIRRLRPLTGC